MYIWKYQSTLTKPPGLTPSSPALCSFFCWLCFGWHMKLWTKFSYTIRHLTGQVRSAIVQVTFCPLHIWYIFVLPVIHPLPIRQSFSCPFFVRYLSVTYALLKHFMRSLHFPRRPSSPPRRISSPDEHLINNYCIFFSVRSTPVTLFR